MGYVKCFCLVGQNGMHCPLSTDKKDLERTFNYQVRGENIIEIEIQDNFVCKEERKDMCKYCPFK